MNNCISRLAVTLLVLSSLCVNCFALVQHAAIFNSSLSVARSGLVSGGAIILPSCLFTMSASPSSLLVVQGSSTSYQVTINSPDDCPVTLSASGQPSGVNITFSPNPSGAGTAIMTVATSGTATLGTFQITITGTSLGRSRIVTVTLLIGPLNPAVSRFVPVTPCRVADTRNATGPFGGPFLAGGTSRGFVIPNSVCNIPSTAQAYSLNVTVVPRVPLGFLTMFPCGQGLPVTSNLNSDGRTKAVAAIVSAGTGGSVCAYTSNDTDLVLDINGYFDPITNAQALAFYPVTPCRVADTRNTPGPLGGPAIPGGTSRTFPILSSSCNLPVTAQAYSLNFTAVPPGSLDLLTVWPAGATPNLISTLSAPSGVVAANAAIVQRGTNGDVTVFVSNNTDLVIDVTGYFAAPGPGGLSLYSSIPCRLFDTRNPAGSSPFSGNFIDNVTANGCGIPGAAQAYALNATVVPPGPLGLLTLWPVGPPLPLASTLNSSDGSINSNMALISTSNGFIEAFASDPTYLVMDIFGYFAP